jgi:hypothetical protein
MTMQDIRIDPPRAEPVRTGAAALESGLGAWASAISADDNAQAAIALAEAINRARHAEANRDNRAADGRIVAVGRLETLRARLAPVYAAIPRDVELFDLGMVGHSPPRLFVDIVAFVELAEDRRSFRLMQETRAGRALLGETTDEKQMTALVTDYIARRLVERERALAAQGMHLAPQPLPRTANGPEVAAGPLPAPVEKAMPEPLAEAAVPAAGLVAPAQSAQKVEEAPRAEEPPRPARAAASSVAPAAAMRRESGGGWLWPLLALLVGVGLGALALYLYAANLARP